ncbi:MAG: ROK family protein, partial [Opitutales bacterium]
MPIPSESLDVRPQVLPPLDSAFLPAASWNRSFDRLVASSGSPVPVRFALEQPTGSIYCHDAEILPPQHPQTHLNFRFAERLVKFLLWSRGGHRVYFDGPTELGEASRSHFKDTATGRFDADFMATVYQRPFEVILTADLPSEQDAARQLGRHLDGCRIGFDLGGSDRKFAAVVDGEVIFSEETAWDPYYQEDPSYHREGIADSLSKAATHLPKVVA